MTKDKEDETPSEPDTNGYIGRWVDGRWIVDPDWPAGPVPKGGARG